jgi:serine protease AprX
VLTVGAVDDRGTPGVGDDRLPDFSSRGPTADGVAKPDVVAPGAHLVSLRAPGSAVDGLFPNHVDGSYRQGSGTSMAAAVASGGVALMLQQHPSWTPGQVKEALRRTARPVASGDPSAVGSGEVRIDAAADATVATPGDPGAQSTGLGSLSASRGTVRVRTNDLLGTVLDGVLTAQLLVWDPVAFTTGNWDASTWPLSAWALHRWYETQWFGDDWQGDIFQGNNWHGDFEGSTRNGQRTPDTYGRPWKGAAWYGLWE